jgi:uncharacterized membrane protein required for colicin V production
MLDFFSTVYLLWGTWRGTKREFCQEFFSVISLSVIFFFSVSLFRLVYKAANEVTVLAGQSGFWSLLMSLSLVLIIWFPIRSRVRELFEKKLGHITSRVAGAIVGFIRVLLVLLLLVTLVSFIPSERVQQFVIGESGIISDVNTVHHWLKPD